MLQFPPHRLIGQALRPIFVAFIISFSFSSALPHSPLALPTSESAGSDTDYFMLYESQAGETVCREATLTERRELEKIKPQGLHQINHLEDIGVFRPGTALAPVTHLTIILRATAHLEAVPAAKAAFIRAATAWENLVTSPVTIFIDADYGSDNFGTPWGSGTLGATSSPSMTVSYSTVRNDLVAGANTPDKVMIYNALPQPTIPTDVGSASSLSVSNSIARAIGVLSPTALDTDTAPKIGFNSAFNFDFDPSDGISTGQFDFEAVVTHEIGHALGFTSKSGSGSSTPAMLDIYRFRTGTTSSTFPTAQRIMTIGGPAGNTLQFFFVPGASELGLSTGGPNGVTTDGGDGNQSSHWKTTSQNGGVFIGIMDPAIPSGIHREITANDSNALNIFGYNSNPVPQPTPPANDNFSAAQVIAGCAGSVNGTNLGATKEANEPNHSPDNGGGSRSVWYQWQSPSTGSVTITTAGSDYDTVMGVYSGSSLGALTSLGKSDDVSASDRTSSVTFSATAGVVYRIAVDGYNNSGSGGDTGSITLNWNATNCTDQIGSVQFSAANYSVNEGGGNLTVTVTRSNGIGSATVDYKTTDTDNFTVGCSDTVNNHGGAFGRCDYANSLDKLTFAAGETSKTFTIPIIDDSIAEGNETFNVVLNNPVGANLGNPSSATVTIVDNDPVTGPNPIFTTPFFVRQQYLDFLSREPEVGEPWSAVLNNCSNVNNDPSCDRITVSAAFFGSQEFQLKGYFVYRFYKLAFNRLPAYSEIVVDMRAVTGSTGNEVFQKKAAFTNAFVLRTEFAPFNGMTNGDYVSTLMGRYVLTQITTPDPAAPDGTNKVTLTTTDLTNRLNGVGGTLTRAQVLRAIADSDQVFAAELNQAFVAMQYFGYLRRSPDAAGYNAWLTYLNAHPTDSRTMVNGFMNSAEYRLRFGPQ